MSEPVEPLATMTRPDEAPPVGGWRARRAAWRAFMRRNPILNTTWRVTVFMIGTGVMIAGLVGLVFPVLPGWALIFVGLAVLATEFAWAEHALVKAKRTAGKAVGTAANVALRRRR
ncbi:MAG: PGPGW domain-containing protein [Mycobacterium leprae]